MNITVQDKDGVSTITYGWADGATETISVNSRALMVECSRNLWPTEGFLPAAVRWMSKNRDIVLFERPPMHVTVDMAYERQELAEMEGTQREVFHLPIPWTLYLVQFNYVYDPIQINVFTRPGPITSLDEEIYLLPLPNFYMNGKLCNPTTPKAEVFSPDIHTGIQRAFNMVWNSGYNQDLYDLMNMARDLHLPAHGGYGDSSYLRAWESLSLSEVLEAEFPYVFTFDDFEEEEYDENDDPVTGYGNNDAKSLRDMIEYIQNYSKSVNNPYKFSTTLVNIASQLSNT